MIQSIQPLAGQKEAIIIEQLNKSFGNFHALKNIDLTIKTGEVHALVGQNGAGKSTLLGILSGRLNLTSGKVHVFGKLFHTGDPRTSRSSGIATIFQELTIVPRLSSVANVFLGQELRGKGFLKESLMRNRFKELCDMMGVSINPSVSAGRLTVGDQQLLEIMRGIQFNAKVLILDEPTASLALPERRSLFKVIESLKQQGMTIIYVSHYLNEVMEISDTITVFRNGEKVETQDRSYWNHQKLVDSMLGDVKIQQPLNAEKTHKKFGQEILRVEELTVPGVIHNVSFTVREGEIVGIGGLAGSGRTTVFRALAGLEPQATGYIWVDGVQVPWPRKPHIAISYGIVLAPEDRKNQGLILGMNSIDNVNLIDLKAIRSNLIFFGRKRATEKAIKLTDQFGLTRPVQMFTRTLSGGNQQKVLLAKACNANPKLLLVDEPTRGIDIGAKAEVLNTLTNISVDHHLGVMIVSSELEEVSSVSDRVLVLSQGRLADELTDNISEENILRSAFKGVET